LFVDAQNFVTDRTEDGDFYAGMARGVKPVVMHGPPPAGHAADAYFANNFIRRGDNAATKAKIAALQADIKALQKDLNTAAPGQKSVLANQIKAKEAQIAALKRELGPKHYMVLWSLTGNALTPTLYPIRPFTIDRFDDWKFVLNASYRNGNLYATFQDCI